MSARTYVYRTILVKFKASSVFAGVRHCDKKAGKQTYRFCCIHLWYNPTLGALAPPEEVSEELSLQYQAAADGWGAVASSITGMQPSFDAISESVLGDYLALQTSCSCTELKLEGNR